MSWSDAQIDVSQGRFLLSGVGKAHVLERFDRVASFSFAGLVPWAKRAIAPGSCVVSDGLAGFQVLERLGFEHAVVMAPKRKAGTEIDAFRWLNIVLGNLKTTLSGTHHAFGFAKYSHRYLAEVQYRFNRRGNLAALVPRLAVAAVQTRPCPKKKILRPSEVWTSSGSGKRLGAERSQVVRC